MFVTREVGHDAQLDLAVVGGEEETSRLRDETLAYLLAVVGAHGDVLQVGIARREPARGRQCLVE